MVEVEEVVKGKVSKRQQTNPLPKDAVSISVKDSYDMHAVKFCPLRVAGPHVPLSEVNALSLNCFLMIPYLRGF